MAWGTNYLGECDVPAPNCDFAAVSAGYNHGLGLKENGYIVVWGSNNWGQCNNVPETNDFVAIAGGGLHSLALKEDGSVVAWGNNSYGQCDVPLDSSFIAVAGGTFHSLGLKEDGSIVAWGHNNYGQCDVPTQNNCFVGVSAGLDHSLGLREISTGVEDEDLTGSFIQIQSVSPNPFSMSTSVLFQSLGLSAVTFEVYDTTGRLVTTQPLGNSPAGQHSITWDGRDSQGAELGSGVYLIRLRSAGQQASTKVVLVR